MMDLFLILTRFSFYLLLKGCVNTVFYPSGICVKELNSLSLIKKNHNCFRHVFLLLLHVL